MMAVAVFHSISGSQGLWLDRPARKEALCLTPRLKRRGNVGLLAESECRLQTALLNVSAIATNVRKPPIASIPVTPTRSAQSGVKEQTLRFGENSFHRPENGPMDKLTLTRWT
jgi:hypothetical protein